MRYFYNLFVLLLCGVMITACSKEEDATDINVSGVTLNKNATTILVGGTETLVATVSPENATNQKVIWTSTDESVATVNVSGVVTGVAEGTATISVTTEDGGKTASCTVTVSSTEVNVTDVILDKESMVLLTGESDNLVATIVPDDATNQNLSWSSEDETIATVDAAGLVKGVSVGETVITVTTEDGGMTATCAVKVTTEEGLLQVQLKTALRKMNVVDETFESWGWKETSPLSEWQRVSYTVSYADTSLQLDLSNAELSGEISEELFQLPGLTSINLSNNDITGELPSTIVDATELVSLDLTNNRITGAVPDELRNNINFSYFRFNPQQEGYEITNTEISDSDADKAVLLAMKEIWGEKADFSVQYTWTEENSLRQFAGVSIDGNGRVARLYLNNLYYLPVEELEKLTSLQILNFVGAYEDKTVISDLPVLESLKELNMSNVLCDNNQLPESLFKLQNLQTLQFVNLGLTNIQEEIGDLTNLKYLELFNNKLTSLPSSIGNLTNLSYLNLGNNGLSSLPSTIGNLTNLTYLNLNNNKFSGAVPAELCNLTNLEYLNLSVNQFNALPSEFNNLTNLTILGLGNNQFNESIMSELSDLVNLTNLDLANTQISVLTPEIADLTNLTDLWLGGEQLKTIPVELYNLTNLTHLSISYSNVSGPIPMEIGNLTNLTSLSVNNNKFSGSIPAELGNLTSLQRADLSKNQFNGSMPAELGNLTNLQVLYLNDNQLSGSIPAELAKMENIKTLDLSNNQLTGSIPAEFAKLDQNRVIMILDDNNLSGSLPDEILNCISLGGYWQVLPQNPGYGFDNYPGGMSQMNRRIDKVEQEKSFGGKSIDELMKARSEEILQSIREQY